MLDGASIRMSSRTAFHPPTWDRVVITGVGDNNASLRMAMIDDWSSYDDLRDLLLPDPPLTRWVNIVLLSAVNSQNWLVNHLYYKIPRTTLGSCCHWRSEVAVAAQMPLRVQTISQMGQHRLRHYTLTYTQPFTSNQIFLIWTPLDNSQQSTLCLSFIQWPIIRWVQHPWWCRADRWAVFDIGKSLQHHSRGKI